MQITQAAEQDPTPSGSVTYHTRVTAARGEILDRNGNVLVGNRASYNLVIVRDAEVYFEEMDVHPRRVDYMTSNMSGGNQQKVILARWMSTDVDIIIFDEPTKGVDVGAKAEIYRLMEQLVEDGKSIIVVSSELPEAMGISDRMIIMSEGRITAELTNKVDFVEDSILDLAIGGNQNEKYMG